MAHGCIAPSEVLDTALNGQFGSIAERFIGNHYLRDVGRSARYPANPYDFQDFSLGFGNVTLLIAFLKDHNPALNEQRLLALRSERGMLRVPDLLTDERVLVTLPQGFPVPPAGRLRMEYYEIKPNSPDGLAAGADKLTRLAALFASFRLPYRPGTAWNPNVRHLLFNGSFFGARVEVYFHYFRQGPGLILYELCVRHQGLEELIQITLIIGIIVAMIVSKGAIPLRPIRLPVRALGSPL